MDDFSFEKRLTCFHQNTEPVLAHYSSCLHKLNTEGSVSEVSRNGFKLMEVILQTKKLSFHDGSVLKWNGCKPKKGTAFSAGFDLHTTETVEIKCGERLCIDTNTSVQLPVGSCGLITGRSGLSMKGLMIFPGVIDLGFTDSLKVMAQNNNDDVLKVEKNTRIAQLIILKIFYPRLVEDTLLGSDRGSFGSTGLL